MDEFQKYLKKEIRKNIKRKLKPFNLRILAAEGVYDDFLKWKEERHQKISYPKPGHFVYFKTIGGNELEFWVRDKKKGKRK